MAASEETNVNQVYGFQRAEMYRSSLAGTVESYDRHLFLCYRNPLSWPSKIEAQKQSLPSLLSAAVKSRNHDISAKTRLTVCEGRYGTDSVDDEVLIFPDMIRYRGLSCLDVNTFVEDVLVRGSSSNWGLRAPEKLSGFHIFVCSHGNRDKRCGHCGPVLVKKFDEEIESRGLLGQVFVRPCSHLGGHQYAGNLIIFGLDNEGRCAGHWYGYVTPNDVSVLLDDHVGRGEVVSRLWRGRMGAAEDELGKKDEVKLNVVQNSGETPPGTVDASLGRENCCQGDNKFSCCRENKLSKGKL